MAGSLPGIPLSQQFDAVGKPLAGALLYIYASNTTTPQDSFQDQGLTLKNPWPLPADNSGRVPMLYLADGSVHVRLTDASGVVQFDYPSMLVVGPSSGGGGGGGGGVDPTTVFQTGDCIWLETTGTRVGWVRDNGKTIGNGVSGASERANADCQNLFVYLWNLNRPDCPVTPGGRGSTALNDFNNNKQIQLPDKRGYCPAGDTAMGNADLGNLAGVPFLGAGNSSTVGSKGGEATHQLQTAEVGAHHHSVYLHDPKHQHGLPPYNDAPFQGGGGTPFHFPINTSGSAINTDLQPTGISLQSAPDSGGLAQGTVNQTADNAAAVGHNTTPLIVIGTYFRKL